jgi:hypothetical protein
MNKTGRGCTLFKKIETLGYSQWEFHLLYIYLVNIWSSHVRQKFLEISTLIGEKKENYPPLSL